MSGGARRLARLYGGLLRLYPPRFRAEYGAELQAVFTLAAEEAAEQGRRAVIRLALRELRDLPAAIIREHRRERNRRQMIAKMSNFFNFEPGSRREALAAVGPLLLLGLVSLLPGVLGLSTAMPHWLDVVMTVAMLGLLLSAVIIGLLKRVPRWFLPYLGFVLPLLSVYVLGDWLLKFRPVFASRSDPWFWRAIVSAGLLWIGLPVAAALIAALSALLPPLRSFYRRIRGDWTLLSFLMYGAVIFPLLFTFDDYQNEEPYLMLALLAVAAGAWFYLRGANRRQRALALFAGLTVAMAVAAAGKAILYSGPDWPRPRFFTWQTEAMSTVIMWGWLALALFTPLLLNYLPPSGLRLPHGKEPPDEKPASWFAAAGAAPFLAAGAILILSEIPYDRGWIESVWNGLFWVFVLLLPAGLAIGWVREFPAWSYPYVSLGLVFGLYVQHGAMPGLHLFGYPTFGREVWGWRAWIPLAAGAAIALLASRSVRPAARFFANIGRDWSLLTFAFYGAMPLLAFAAFDEMDRQYSLPFIILLAVMMAATPALYLRSGGANRRALVLLAGVVATVGVAVAGPAVYWHQKGYSVTGSVIGGSVWIAVVCFPLLLSWLGRTMANRRAPAG